MAVCRKGCALSLSRCDISAGNAFLDLRFHGAWVYLRTLSRQTRAAWEMWMSIGTSNYAEHLLGMRANVSSDERPCLFIQFQIEGKKWRDEKNCCIECLYVCSFIFYEPVIRRFWLRLSAVEVEAIEVNWFKVGLGHAYLCNCSYAYLLDLTEVELAYS